MSSISGLPISGPGQVESAKPAPVSKVAPGQAESESASSPLDKVAAKYPNPAIKLDPALDRIIFEYRDSINGDVTYQVPSKAQLRLYTLGASAEPGDTASTPEAQTLA